MHLSEKSRKKIICVRWVLLVTYGVLFILVGVDKFCNYLTHWQRFVGFALQNFLLLSPWMLIRLFGVLQIILGVALLIYRNVWCTYALLAMLLFIFLNLFSTVDYQVVIAHDGMMIVHSIVLILLSQIEL